MSLCTDDTTTYSDSTLSDVFSRPNVTPALPGNSPGAGDRTGAPYNLLTPGYLTGYINQLSNNGKIPRSPPADISLSGTNSEIARGKITKYITDAEIMKIDLLAEYCFYNSRYHYAMRILIRLIADATAGTMTDSTRITSLTQSAIMLNQKLTDLTQIVNAITVHLYQSSHGLTTTINDLNTKIDGYAAKLREHALILQSEAPAAELSKRMVEFTREKSLASNNLLSFYFFMDVVALGILFYVYKAS
jgi:hypothetical protein